MEKAFERLLFASRWLMAPMYLGLVAVLGMMLAVFLRQTFYYVPQALTMSAETAILAALSLIDLTLAANLLLIVIFSGYENFVSKMNMDGHEDRPEWQGTVDFSGLKLKLIASIVAISGIHLLKVFMDVTSTSPEQIRWMVIIHLVFVISGVLLALMDWITVKAKPKK